MNRARPARSMRLQRLVFSPRFLELLGRLPPRAFHVAWRSLMRLNLRHGPRPELDPRIDAALTAELEPAVQPLEAVLGRALPTWRHSRGARA
ncbi:MAG TPA: hypothetical protein VGP30_00365 [Candidatus Limnocylindrales bacterium]|nr:hypothetical protein [Candidatus Limnocylindrales bacterium]